MRDDTDAGATTRAEEPEPSLLRSLWHALQSIRTTVYLMILIAAAATIGAVIPQDRPAEYYEMVYGGRWAGLVTGLGLDRLYGSTWFVILLALLLLNLAACARRSWRRAVARARGPSAAALARKFEGGSAAQCWHGTTEVSDAGVRLATILQRARYTVRPDEGRRRSTRLLAQREPLAAYGTIMTHLAVFLVALGAVLGALPWTSLDERMTLVEGETRGSSDGGLELPFDVRLDDFRMTYYPETGTPSSYESDVTLLSGGAEQARGTATVNAQVAHRGVSLGQSSWGISGVRVRVDVADGWGDEIIFPVTEAPGPHGDSTWALNEEGRAALLPGGDAALVADHFVADAVEQDGQILGSQSQYPRSPALLITVVSGLDKNDHEFHSLGWLRPDGELSYEQCTFRFGDIVYRSTLSVRKDPGLPLVWAGFALVTLGMIVAFYLRPSAFLVDLIPVSAGTGAQVRVAPSGPELGESERRLVEKGAVVRLRPMSPPPSNGSRPG